MKSSSYVLRLKLHCHNYFKGMFHSYCDQYADSTNLVGITSKVKSVFAGIDFSKANLSNQSHPKDWLIHDFGFVLKMNEKRKLSIKEEHKTILTRLLKLCNFENFQRLSISGFLMVFFIISIVLAVLIRLTLNST